MSAAVRSGQAAILTNPLWTVVAVGCAVMVFTIAALRLEAQTRLSDIVDQESRPYAVAAMRGAA